MKGDACALVEHQEEQQQAALDDAVLQEWLGKADAHDESEEALVKQQKLESHELEPGVRTRLLYHHLRGAKDDRSTVASARETDISVREEMQQDGLQERGVQRCRL